MTRLSRRVVSAAATTALLGLLAAPQAEAATSVTPDTPYAVQRQQILDGMNAERAKVGAPPLKPDSRLQPMADEWISQLTSEEQGPSWTLHHRPDLQQRVQRATGCIVPGEILAMAGTSEEDYGRSFDGNQAMRQWIASQPHHEAMQNSVYESAAISVSFVKQDVVVDGRSYEEWEAFWTVNFAGNCGQATPPRTDTTEQPKPKPIKITRGARKVRR